MTTYNEAAESIAQTKLNELNLTEGERKFMEGLIDSQLNCAGDITYPVHPTEDVAIELGLTKHQGAGFVSSLLKKGLIVLDDELIIQNIMEEEEVLELSGN